MHPRVFFEGGCSMYMYMALSKKSKNENFFGWGRGAGSVEKIASFKKDILLSMLLLGNS
jgi:hypothetical protein